MTKQRKMPPQFREYPCDDYFAEGWAETGYFDEHSQTSVITPFAQSYENPEASFFVVGRSGADGIDFGYRKGHPGIWAHHPIDGEFQFMAHTVAELIHGWCSGNLTV